MRSRIFKNQFYLCFKVFTTLPDVSFELILRLLVIALGAGHKRVVICFNCEAIISEQQQLNHVATQWSWDIPLIQLSLFFVL